MNACPHVVVDEAVVLLGVQDLEQSRGGVPADAVPARLVHLVQQEEGVLHLGPPEGLDDAPGHGADVGPTVAADLGLVPHAPQRHALQGPAQDGRDAARQRRLAHPGGADEAQHGSLDVAPQPLDRDVLDYALLDFVEAVVGLV